MQPLNNRFSSNFYSAKNLDFFNGFLTLESQEELEETLSCLPVIEFNQTQLSAEQIKCLTCCFNVWLFLFFENKIIPKSYLTKTNQFLCAERANF